MTRVHGETQNWFSNLKPPDDSVQQVLDGASGAKKVGFPSRRNEPLWLLCGGEDARVGEGKLGKGDRVTKPHQQERGQNRGRGLGLEDRGRWGHTSYQEVDLLELGRVLQGWGEGAEGGRGQT